MPKRKPPKVINQEILKAVQYLTNKNPYVSVKLGDIVKRVQYQVREIPFESNMDKMIREAIFKLRDLGLIDHFGHNQYYCADCFADSELEETAKNLPPPISGPGKPDPVHFQPNNQKKSLPESSSALDPNRKRRESAKSSTSLSGDDSFERTRKRFYGRKKLVKIDKNVPLPGARQVAMKKRKLPELSKDIVKRQKLQNEKCAANFREVLSDTDICYGLQIKEIPASSWADIPHAITTTKSSYVAQLSEPAGHDESTKNIDFDEIKNQSRKNLVNTCNDTLQENFGDTRIESNNEISKNSIFDVDD